MIQLHVGKEPIIERAWRSKRKVYVLASTLILVKPLRTFEKTRAGMIKIVRERLLVTMLFELPTIGAATVRMSSRWMRRLP